MVSSPGSSRTYRSKSSQRGEAELLVFGLVIFIAALFSGTVYIIQWVKHNKYAERQARRLEELAQRAETKAAPRRDPAEYVVACSKPIWAITAKSVPCEILPESYGELFLKP